MIATLRASSQRLIAGQSRLAVAVILISLGVAGVATVPLTPLPMVALTALAVLALAAVLAGAILLNEQTAERLLLVYIFLLPFQFGVFPLKIASDGAGFGFRMSLADLVFPLLMVPLLVTRPANGSVLRSKTALLGIALVMAFTVSWIQSVGYLGSITAYSTGKFVSLLYLVAVAAVVIDVVRERSLWVRAVDTLAISGVIVGAIGLAGWLLWSVGGVSTVLMEYDRLASTMFGAPNPFASFMAVSLVLTIMRASSSSGRERWLWAAGAAVVLLALIFSQSRGGGLGAAGGLVFLAVRYRPAAGLAAAFLLILVGTIVWASYTWADSPDSTISENSRFSNKNVQVRFLYWRRGVELLRAEAPIGIGVGTFKQMRLSPEVGFVRLHNSYLSTLLQLGLPGSVALVLVGAAVAGAVRRARDGLRGSDTLRLSGLVAGLIAMLMFAFWTEALYQRHLWVLVALVLSSANLKGDTEYAGNSTADERMILRKEAVR